MRSIRIAWLALLCLTLTASCGGGGSAARCSVAADCDDDDACTTDTCSAQGTCEHAPFDCTEDPVCGDGVIGDGVIGAGERCDGADLDGERCDSQGFTGGTLRCLDDCSGYDTAGCTNVACSDDPFEDNDERSTAAPVTAGSYPALRSCAGDDDFYAIVLSVGDQLMVELTFRHDEGNIDVRLLGPGGRLVAARAATADNEILVYTATTGGTHTIALSLAADAGSSEGNDYDMKLAVVPAATTCADDDLEDNDFPATATPVASASYANLRGCPGDDDFYAIPLSVGDRITVDLAFVHAAGNLDLKLLDPSGTVVASSASTTNTETMTYTATTAGVYRLGVSLTADAGGSAGNDYDLDVGVVPAPTLCSDDAFEDDDFAAGAARVAAGSYASLRICPGDDDFYAISLSAGYEITVDLAFTHAQGNIDLELLAPSGTVVASSASTAGAESVTFTAATTGVYTVRVYLSADAGVSPGNDYDMDIAVVPAATTCADDAYEDNDDPSIATPVTAAPFSNLRICPSDDDYFALELTAGAQITVALTFARAEGTIDVTLLDPRGTEVAWSTSTVDGENLEYVVATSGTHTIRVWLRVDAGLNEGNDYDMDLSIP